jgi:hypothetical protein
MRMRKRVGRSALRLLAWTSLTWLCLGCRRELLTPTECEYLAQRLAGITAPYQLRNPRIRGEVEERTQRCLVRPYDRSFLRCLETQGRLDQCETELASRLPR